MSAVLRLPDGTGIANLSTHYFFDRPPEMIRRTGRAVCSIRRIPLRGGTYTVDLYCSVDGELADRLQGAATFDVADGDYYCTGRLTRFDTGVVALDHEWRFTDETA